MGTTLVINGGSASQKIALAQNGRVRASFRYEYTPDGLVYTSTIDEKTNAAPLPEQALTDALAHALTLCRDTGCLTSEQSIDAIGVRVVAPGTYFQTHRLVDEQYMDTLSACTDRAPLHIPLAYHTLEAVRTQMRAVPCVGVSDSAFHHTLPAYARQFSIPPHDAAQFDIYRFGYHGLSVASVVRKLRILHGTLPSRVIVCHIGSGMSVTAVRDGQSIDTSMGYAPGSGLVMGTRAGDLEASALLAYMTARNEAYTSGHHIIQTGGGLKALSGVADLRIIVKRYHEHDHEAEHALNVFLYRLQVTIGGMVAALGGVDAIVFTATALERNATLRALLAERIRVFGAELADDVNNEAIGTDARISTATSTVPLYVIRTDEMGEMCMITDAVAGTSHSDIPLV